MVLCSATMTIIVEKIEWRSSVYYLYLYMNVYRAGLSTFRLYDSWSYFNSKVDCLMFKMGEVRKTSIN